MSKVQILSPRPRSTANSAAPDSFDSGGLAPREEFKGRRGCPNRASIRRSSRLDRLVPRGESPCLGQTMQRASDRIPTRCSTARLVFVSWISASGGDAVPDATPPLPPGTWAARCGKWAGSGMSSAVAASSPRPTTADLPLGTGTPRMAGTGTSGFAPPTRCHAASPPGAPLESGRDRQTNRVERSTFSGGGLEAKLDGVHERRRKDGPR